MSQPEQSDAPNVIRIRVLNASDEVEVLTLTGPLTIMPRVPDSPFTKLLTSTGMEHWFTDDGLYDGWGMDVSGLTVADPQEALDIAQAIDDEREKL
jgi:hypothetical protein